MLRRTIDYQGLTTFEDWTKIRVPLVFGTNAGSPPLPFQNWRRLKEAFVPELIQRAVAETSKALGRPVKSCLDPFSGSGTTPLACQFLGVHPVAIEVNPFLADLTEAKLCVVDEAMVARRCGEVISTTQTNDPYSFYGSAPPTFVEPGKNGRYLFQRDIAERIANLVGAISRIPEPDIARLLKVLLSSAALCVCNATVSGKGRRYRKNWQNIKHTPAELDSGFIEAVESAVFDLTRYAKRKVKTYDLRRGDARLVVSECTQVDLAVFSPPYPNSFDYTDVYNIELWSLGYLKNKADNTALRNSTLRSHVQINRDFSFAPPTLSISNCIEQLRSADGLWNKNIPEMIGSYFADLEIILRGTRSVLPVGGRVYIVVGDSRYAGVNVPVADALVEMAPALGFELLTSEPFRSMRVSPQQGGRAELPETLLTFAAI